MNRIWKFIFQRSGKITSNTQGHIWESIDDMILYDWMKCLNGELKYVSKKRKEHATNQDAWEKLYDQYLATYGLGEKFEKYLKLLQKKAMLQCDYVITRDRFKLNEIEVQQAKIDSMQMHFGDGQTIQETLIYLSKWLGYKVDIKSTTVREYYDLIENYGKWSNKKE